MENVWIRRGGRYVFSSRFPLSGKALVLTDDGVPRIYAEAIAKPIGAEIVTVPAGERSKSLAVYERIAARMLSLGFSRGDALIAVGGGMVCDLGGFAAATYMRGIACYLVPTTVLAMVDASIGGKTALNLAGVKNAIGVFAEPRGVLIDPDVLDTLPAREAASGLAEAIKMALTLDAALFEAFERGVPDDYLARAIALKQDIVRRDPKEMNLRRVLNFGHTIGHGIESASGGALLHGECVAIGMLPMCSEPVRRRLLPVLSGLRLPTAADVDPEAAYAALLHDKKSHAGGITVVRVDEIGSFRFETVAPETLRPLIDTVIRRERL